MDNKIRKNNFDFLKLKSSEYAELVAAELFKNELGNEIEILFPLKRNFKDSDFFLYVNHSNPPKIISVQVKFSKLFTNNKYNEKREQLGNAVFMFKTNKAAKLYCLIFYVPSWQRETQFLKPQMLVMDIDEFKEIFKKYKKNGGYRFSLATKKGDDEKVFIEKTKKAKTETDLTEHLIHKKKKELKDLLKAKTKNQNKEKAK